VLVVLLVLEAPDELDGFEVEAVVVATAEALLARLLLVVRVTAPPPQTLPSTTQKLASTENTRQDGQQRGGNQEWKHHTAVFRGRSRQSRMDVRGTGRRDTVKDARRVGRA
jgi:hypothetical protein